jgi:hypothetical protein
MPIKPNYILWETQAADFPKNQTLSEQLKFICRFGHLAPSSHNTQPWYFKIKDNTIQVHADLSRNLPAADPTNKELYISVGCTIPNLEIAASQFGFLTSTTILPNPKNPDHIATIQCTKSNKAVPHPLFPFITKRLTNRSMFQKRKPLPSRYVEDLQTQQEKYTPISLKIFSQADQLKTFAQLTKDGMYAALSKPSFRQELSTWVRHSWTDQGDGLPTNTLGIPDAVSVLAIPMIRSPLMAVTSSKLEYKMILSSSAVGIFIAPENTRPNWIATGISYTFLALVTCKYRLAIEPLSATIEMPVQKKQLKSYIKLQHEPMMFFRIGHSTEKFPHAPRRPMNEVIHS